MGEIVEKNQGMVYHLAKHYHTLCEVSYLDMDDLMQLGNIGLMEAVKGFDPDYGVKFSTYAGVAIKGHISRGLRYSTPWKDRKDPQSELCHLVSSSDLIPGAENTCLEDVLEDVRAFNAYSLAEEELDRLNLRKDLFSVLDTVFKPHDRIKNVLILNNGLNGHEYSLKEIGEIYGISGERTRQLNVKGLRRIRKSNAGRDLMEKYEEEYIEEVHTQKVKALVVNKQILKETSQTVKQPKLSFEEERELMDSLNSLFGL
ncbi:sigma-70 family RNA polymerase sigma factor [Eubacteriaceae bacterium ES3]|nr:sigma-70 family RNA polymerase sigma factor [Eubacteriaceae bacterium ES3]